MLCRLGVIILVHHVDYRSDDEKNKEIDSESSQSS